MITPFQGRTRENGDLQHYLQTLVEYLARQLRLLLSRRGADEVAGTHCRDVTHQLSLTILVGMIDLSPVHEASGITYCLTGVMSKHHVMISTSNCR